MRNKNASKDPMTTFRSDEYTLVKPYFPPASTTRTMNTQELLNTMKHKEGRIERLMQKIPSLGDALAGVADARLRMLSSDENDDRYRSKKYGWGRKFTPKPMPQNNDYFSYKLINGDNGEELIIDDSDLALELAHTNRPEYERLRKIYEDWMANPAYETFLPMTKEEATKDSLAWYPSTNEFLNGVLATDLSEDDREALYDAAQYALAKAWTESGGENGKYAKAAKYLLKDGRLNTGDQFGVPNGVKNFIANAVAPVSSAVMFDPEYDFKTGTGERVARAAGDALLTAGSIILPWGAASRGAMMAARPFVGATIGGALGGGLNYGAERLAHEIYKDKYGHGYIEQPVDATDIAISMGLGAFEGPMSGLQTIRGMNKMKTKMMPSDPSRVKPNDIKSSIRLAKQYGTKSDAAIPFASDAFKSLEKKYPELKYAVDMLPPLDKVPDRADVFPLQLDLPGGRPVMKTGKRGGGNEDKFVMTTNLPGADQEIPISFVKPNPSFFKQYRELNPSVSDWFGYGGEDLYGLGTLAAKAQVKDAPERAFFGNGKVIFNPDEFSENMSRWRGQNLYGQEMNLANKAKSKLFSGDRKVGEVVDGNFVESSGKKLKDFEEANKKYKDRKKMNLVDVTDWEGATRSGALSQTARKVAIPLLIRGTDNAVPFGSNIIMGVQPYTYEPYAGADKK